MLHGSVLAVFIFWFVVFSMFVFSVYLSFGNFILPMKFLFIILFIYLFIHFALMIGGMISRDWLIESGPPEQAISPFSSPCVVQGPTVEDLFQAHSLLRRS